MRSVVFALVLLASSAAAETPARIVADQLAGLGAEAAPHLVGWPNDVRMIAPALASLHRFAAPVERVTLDRLLGNAAEQRFEGNVALRHYRAGLAGGAAGHERAALLLGIARVESWRDPAAARRTLDQLGDTPEAAAAVSQLRARLALTEGNGPAARAALADALAALALLPATDAAAMGASLAADAATIAATFGTPEEAASTAAAAGWARTGNQVALIPEWWAAAVCSENGAHAEDEAVFDVAVGVQAPARVTLVRASHLRAVEPLGAALAAWEWPAAGPKDPPLRRAGFHVRLSCSERGEPPMPAMAEVWPQPLDWFVERGIALPREDADVAALKAGLAAARAPGQHPAAPLPWLLQMAIDPRIGMKETRRLLVEAQAVARGADAPFAFSGMALLLSAMMQPGAEGIEALAELIAIIPKGPDTRALADLARIQLGNLLLAAGRRDQAIATWRVVADQPEPDSAGWGAGLPRIARIRIALAADTGDAASDARFQAAGLATDICWPSRGVPQGIDLEAPPHPPAAKQVPGLVWTFADIDSSGLVTNVRVAVATPPGLFEDSAQAAVRSYQFAPAADGQGLPCRLQQLLLNMRR